VHVSVPCLPVDRDERPRRRRKKGGSVKKLRQYRQGDLLILPVESIPESAKQVGQRQNRLVLAEGEATGHAHVLTAPAVEEYVTDTDERFFRIMAANGLVAHDEHETITLPHGDYEVRRQREYTPEEIRRVAD
jgi:hypothetical protein